MSRRVTVGALLLLAWFGVARFGALTEPVVLLLLGLLLATAGLLARRSSEKRAALKASSPRVHT